MTASVLRLSDHRSLRNQAIADLYRAEAALRRAGVRAEIGRGTTEEGDPWVSFVRPDDGSLIAHVAVIDGQVVIDSPAFNRPLWGKEAGPLVTKLLGRLRGANDRLPTNLVLVAGIVALAAAHVSEVGPAWSPIAIDGLGEAASIISALPALLVIRAVQSAETMTLEEHLPVQTVRPNYNAEARPQLTPERIEIEKQAEEVPVVKAGSQQSQIAISADVIAVPQGTQFGPPPPVAKEEVQRDLPIVALLTPRQDAQSTAKDPRDASLEQFRNDILSSVAEGKVVQEDIPTVLAMMEAYIRANKAGVSEVDTTEHNSLIVHSNWSEGDQIFHFSDGAVIKIVGISNAEMPF